jgi:hypothetical protein
VLESRQPLQARVGFPTLRIWRKSMQESRKFPKKTENAVRDRLYEFGISRLTLRNELSYVVTK